MEIWWPRRPETLEEAKVNSFFVRDLILKTLYVRGVTRGYEFSEIFKLPFYLIDAEIRHHLQTHLIGPVGGAGVGGANGVDYTGQASPRLNT